MKNGLPALPDGGFDSCSDADEEINGVEHNGVGAHHDEDKEVLPLDGKPRFSSALLHEKLRCTAAHSSPTDLDQRKMMVSATIPCARALQTMCKVRK